MNLSTRRNEDDRLLTSTYFGCSGEDRSAVLLPVTLLVGFAKLNSGSLGGDEYFSLRGMTIVAGGSGAAEYRGNRELLAIEIVIGPELVDRGALLLPLPAIGAE